VLCDVLADLFWPFSRNEIVNNILSRPPSETGCASSARFVGSIHNFIALHKE
jgi:hypothetical protein